MLIALIAALILIFVVLTIHWLDFTPAKNAEEEARRERKRSKSAAVRGLIALLTTELCELARGKQPSGNTVAFIITQLWQVMDASEKGCPQPCVESDAEIMRAGWKPGKSKGLLSLASTIEGLSLCTGNPVYERALTGLALWLRGEPQPD